MCFFAEVNSLGEFYLLKELLCKETQIGIERFNEKLTKHLVPENEYKERICDFF